MTGKDSRMTKKSSQSIAEEVAKQITTLRLSRAWTRQNLADASGVNVHTLKRFERSGQISLDRLIAICQVLGIADELERLFKPRQRISVDHWKAPKQPQRKRGLRRDARRKILIPIETE